MYWIYHLKISTGGSSSSSIRESPTMDADQGCQNHRISNGPPTKRMNESSHLQKSNLLLQTHRRNGSSSAVSIVPHNKRAAFTGCRPVVHHHLFLSSLIKSTKPGFLSQCRHLTLQHRALPDCSFRHRQIMCCGDW